MPTNQNNGTGCQDVITRRGHQLQAATSEQALELVQDKLYRLGGAVELDGRISWIPHDREGFEPINCYLIKDGSHALLVDTGVAAHRDLVVQQLKELIGDQTPLSIFLTRFEPDCLSNLAEIVEKFPVEHVYGGGVSNPFDFFDDLSTDEQLRHDYHVDIVRKIPGDVLRLSEQRTLTLVVTSIRLLATFWAYDHETRTLFTSDTFGHMQLRGIDETPVFSKANDTATVDTVRQHLLTKFDWLSGAEKEPLQRDLHDIFDQFPVEVIAPTHGAVLKGSETISRHYQFVQQVLSELHQ